MNVTTPVPVAYPVTVQFETIALDVFKYTAMFAASKLAVLGPLKVSVCAVTAVPTSMAVDTSVVCVIWDGSAYSSTLRLNAVALVAYPPCTTPSGLLTRAKNRKALPASGKTHDDTRTFPDVSNAPWPMSNGEDGDTTPDTSVRNMETDPAFVREH